MKTRLLPILLAGALLAGQAQKAHAQISDNVVRIGVLNDQSGIFSDNAGPGSVAAARMAVEDFGGSVLGKPIAIVSADHQNKPDIAAAIARKWIDVDGVDAIADLAGSAPAFAALTVTREKNKLLLLSSPASTDFTGPQCAPTTIHWTYDSYALAKGTVQAVVQKGDDRWFFLTADSAGSHAMEKDAMAFVAKAGGKTVGAVRHPFNTADFSSFLLQAQTSGAKVIGLASAGMDAVNTIKQASEFGIQSSGQKFAGLVMYIGDVDGIGLKDAQGLMVTEPFYWDLNEKTRAWSERFRRLRDGRVPSSIQAGVYGSVLHYLKAVEAAGTDEGLAVAKAMKRLPVNDFFTENGRVREDGRVIRDMYLFRVKTPAESSGRWDYYTLQARIPGEQAFRPLEEGGCPLVK